MSEVVTPAADPQNPAPAAPPTPAEPSKDDTVTLPKAELEQLKRDAARAAAAQSKADRLTRQLGGQTGFRQTPVAPVPTERTDEQVAIEERKAERGLINLALDPNYRELLDKNPDLRDMLTKNPLGALPILAPEALDAEDAIALVKEQLDLRASSIKESSAKAAPAPSPAAPAAPVAPKPGATDAPSQKDIDTRVEEARKLPNAESAVAGMISAKLPRQYGTK